MLLLLAKKASSNNFKPAWEWDLQFLTILNPNKHPIEHNDSRNFGGWDVQASRLFPDLRCTPLSWGLKRSPCRGSCHGSHWISSIFSHLHRKYGKMMEKWEESNLFQYEKRSLNRFGSFRLLQLGPPTQPPWSDPSHPNRRIMQLGSLAWSEFVPPPSQRAFQCCLAFQQLALQAL